MAVGLSSKKRRLPGQIHVALFGGNEVMRADDAYLRLVGQRSQPLPIFSSSGKVGGHHALVECQSGRHVGSGAMELTMMEEGATGVDEPTIVDTDGYASMSQGMTAERNHQDFGRQAVDVADRAEAEPGLAAFVIGAPVADRVPVERPVTLAVDEGAAAIFCGVLLDGQHMDPRFGKILDTAGMIEIEMGQDYVADVAGRKAEPLDLAQRGIVFAKPRVQHQDRPGDRQTPARLARHVLQPVAGIDQNEAGIGFEQQGMRADIGEQAGAPAIEEGAAHGTMAAAIEVVDLHGRHSLSLIREAALRASR